MKNHVSQHAGKFLFVGVASTSLSQTEKEFLKEVQPKGVIYFRRNVKEPNQLIDLTREIRSCIHHPVIIGIDQEGGRVARLQDPFTTFPGNEMLAGAYEKTKDDRWIVNKAKWMSKELKAIGVNCNFAPVADILTYKENPIMKERTFGEDPHKVASLVAKTIEVFEKENILSCAKHFPGHGDTVVDSHLELPSVDTDQKTLFQRELIPFQKAISQNVPMIMTAHICYQNIKPDVPATLSKYFLQTILREKLKFQGCIVSDDLEMKAIAHHYDMAQASKQAIEAGCNMVMICEDQSVAYQCFEVLQRALKNKKVQQRLEENLRLFKKWDKTYLKGKVLRKKDHWDWKRHRFPQKVDTI